MNIAELKRVCEKPEVVEIWDTTASDPQLLVFLKAYRNTVPIPRHWCQKRKFLQGKRGIEKPPWQLPDFIEATGISKMRQAYQEKEDSKKLKQKQRDKTTPKMGKMDIDYQVCTRPHACIVEGDGFRFPLAFLFLGFWTQLSLMIYSELLLDIPQRLGSYSPVSTTMCETAGTARRVFQTPDQAQDDKSRGHVLRREGV
jgi:hypothetical protein